MVRVAALKNAVAEGDTAPDVAGLTPAPAAPADLGARPRDGGRGSTPRSPDEILPALGERGIRLLPVDDARRRAARAPWRATSRDEVLPALTPLAIDSSRPFPLLAGLSLNLAVLARPRAEGEERPRLAVVQVPGAAAAPGAAGGRRRHDLRAARGRDPRRAGRALPRAGRSSSRPSSASRATPSWTSTTKAGATSWRRSRRSCGTGGEASVVRLEVEAGVERRRCSPSCRPRLAVGARGRLPRHGPARHPARCSPSSTCPRSRTCATRR